jgi:hypothetical protein
MGTDDFRKELSRLAELFDTAIVDCGYEQGSSSLTDRTSPFRMNATKNPTSAKEQ